MVNWSLARSCQPLQNDGPLRGFQSIRLKIFDRHANVAKANEDFFVASVLRRRACAQHEQDECCREEIFPHLFTVGGAGTVSFLDAELFQPILQSAKREAEELCRLRDVVIRLLHRLRDQIALDILEVDAFSR